MIKTEIFKIDPDDPDVKIIDRCARIIVKGGLVAFPTETVYGLGASALDEDAVDRIYKVKNRPRTKPLAIQVADIKTIEKMGYRLTPAAMALASVFWPGPLTMVLEDASGRKMGFRMPAHKVALGLLKKTGLPIAVPSANLSGEPPAKNARDVRKSFDGKIEAILDGGEAYIGVESTVVDLAGDEPKILREGAISRERILEACGRHHGKD